MFCKVNFVLYRWVSRTPPRHWTPLSCRVGCSRYGCHAGKWVCWRVKNYWNVIENCFFNPGRDVFLAPTMQPGWCGENHLYVQPCSELWGHTSGPSSGAGTSSLCVSPTSSRCAVQWTAEWQTTGVKGMTFKKMFYHLMPIVLRQVVRQPLPRWLLNNRQASSGWEMREWPRGKGSTFCCKPPESSNLSRGTGFQYRKCYFITTF